MNIHLFRLLRHIEGGQISRCPIQLKHKVKKLVDLLEHAYRCKIQNCQHPKCAKMKGMYRHTFRARTKCPGFRQLDHTYCGTCPGIRQLVRVHSQACKKSNCGMSHCRDYKKERRSLRNLEESLTGMQLHQSDNAAMQE